MIVETLIEMRKKWENKGLQKGIQEGMQKGKQEGRKEAILEIAMQLLEEGLSVEFIAKVTKLPISEIEKLASRLG